MKVVTLWEVLTQTPDEFYFNEKSKNARRELTSRADSLLCNVTSRR